ncbi:MAG: TraM recognition domain-containing protein [Pseudomonadota bacterium]
MSFPFGRNPFARKRHPYRRMDDPQGQRIIGLVPDTKIPIFAPPGHSLLLAANGAGKTVYGAATWLISLIATASRPAVLVADHKNGELARQFVPMLAELGLPFAVVDDGGVLPVDYPGRVSLNPISAVIESFRRAPEDLIFATEAMAHALIEEPPEGDERNRYFRDWPRRLIEFATMVLLKRNPDLATPGSVWALLSDPQMMVGFARIEAEEGDGMLRVLARNILGMIGHEHWPQHLQAAQDALRIFATGTRLAAAGQAATTSPAMLIRDRAIIFLVGSQRHIRRMGAYYAMQLTGFLDALYAETGPLTLINDEFTNGPLQQFVDSLTTIRAFGGEAHNIAQSRSEIEKKFGKHAVDTIEENAIIKHWYGFSGFSEAKRVSEMMGEQMAVQESLGADNASVRLQTNLSLTKQRWMSPAELMAMPTQRQLIHVKGLGFFLADKIGQQHFEPYSRLLAPNTLEGGCLTPDPKIRLPYPSREVTP